MSGHITVVGSANVDYVIQLPHLPQRGESVTGGPFTQSYGGKGSNQALAAKRSGANVSAVFNLGGDDNAKRLLEIYCQNGIEVSHVTLNPGHTCGVGIILVDANGDNAIATALGANALLSCSQVEQATDIIAQSKLVMLQMEVTDEVNQYTIDLAQRYGVEVMLNFAPAAPSSLRLDKSIGILVVNETEALHLTGIDASTITGAENAARKLSRNGHRIVIITLGGDGCLVFSEDSPTHFPAFTIDAVDATGAGDTFCGAFAAALVEGRPLTEAIRFASAAGALCASRIGALPSIPLRQEIDGFLE